MKIIEGNIASPLGFLADGKHVGLKNDKKDMGMLYSTVPAQAAAVFTTNVMKAAPIFVTKDAWQTDGTLQAVIVNSGNANACTGTQGLDDAKTMQQVAAAQLGLAPEAVAVASTGMIGVSLPMPKITAGIAQMDVKNGVSADFAQAILTTDTQSKEIVVTQEIGGQLVTMAGCAKGSGMIHPNMATMLGFITTDAKIDQQLLQATLASTTEVTFNQITVDGDTSTNDMVIVLANGQANNPEITADTPEYVQFLEMFKHVMGELAKKIAQDGEGATKLIEVTVKNATNELDARMMAKKIVGSSLVKTAIFGSDPNWGRIICALGYSGGVIDPASIDIQLGSQTVLQDSTPVTFDDDLMTSELEQAKVSIVVDVKQGSATGLAWGCDLTYKYVEINALYDTSKAGGSL
ncbi:MAG: bifunctional glutamate N-acetyltransferase/amino-acid acetyltransferase ArgJ [Lactobacillaceae bacterium]|jgi:glutamate N-acetyltransferase/amino-acid N-acetyltransferase|nr:bifunctional glutamate N-acetyltransferase/amino-acid acetyltransferase ArgJ [Lactobacillaceae bacterium]